MDPSHTLSADDTIPLASLDWDKGGGQIPVVVQDSHSLRVLMVGVMNPEALAQTQRTGLVTFWSRTKGRLWQKGETSGHVLQVTRITADCDGDALLIQAQPNGVTCHTGMRSCFDRTHDPMPAGLAILADLEKTIHDRRDQNPDTSYTARLFAKGIARIAQKVGEEGVEVALAAATHAPNLTEEVADLLYHVLVLLAERGLTLDDALTVLRTRAQKAAAPLR